MKFKMINIKLGWSDLIGPVDITGMDPRGPDPQST